MISDQNSARNGKKTKLPTILALTLSHFELCCYISLFYLLGYFLALQLGLRLGLLVLMLYIFTHEK